MRRVSKRRIGCQITMKTKREDIQRSYSLAVFGSLIVGLITLATSLVFFIFIEVLGPSALKNPQAQEQVVFILRLVVLGMLPTLGVALLGVSHMMRQYRKFARSENAA
jgi:hypothetical protein